MRPCDRSALWLVLGMLAVASPRVEAAGAKRERPAPPVAPIPPAAPDSLRPLMPVDPGNLGRPLESLRRKTLAYDLVKLGQNVHVHADEVIRGDVVVLGGDLRVEGQIEGGAVVVGGTIDIGPRARIDGEAVALGGRVEQASGADVRGGAVGLSILPGPFGSGTGWRRAQRIATLVGDVIGFLLLLAWMGVIVLLLRRRLRAARTWLTAAPWRTAGLGVLALTGGLFAIIMGIVLLAITLIGLPISLLLAAATVVLLLVALATGVLRLGELTCGALRWRTEGILLPALVGSFVVVAPQIAADVVRLGEWGEAGMLRALHATVVVLAMASGLGALVLSRLGRSDYSGSQAAPRSPRGATPTAVP